MIDAPIATTAHGPVRGATEDGILVFKGIPYGATTAGAARFHPPAPPVAWSAVRDALAYPPMAPQSVFTPGSLFTSWTFEKDISDVEATVRSDDECAQHAGVCRDLVIKVPIAGFPRGLKCRSRSR